MRLTDAERARLNAAMDAYADGDDKAFGEVYDLLAPRLVGYFMRNTDGSRCEDLTHDTLLHIHAARRNYVPGSDMTPWAFCIARNVLIDAYKKTRKEFLYRATREDVEAVDMRVDRSSNPDDFAMARQSLEAVNEVIGALSESLRAVWNLHVEGLSPAHAAESLGISQNAVEVRLCRVREELRLVFEGKNKRA